MANARNARSASAADFAATNPWLGDGEERVETDTGKSKIGPGYWNDLDYGAGQTGGGSGASGPVEQVAEFLFTEVATAAKVTTYAITAVDTGTSRFTVAGDQLAGLPRSLPFDVSGSTGNDGSYSIADVSLVGGDTVVTVNEVVASAVADGTITTTSGRYVGSLDFEAGATLVAVYGLQLAGPWAADTAALDVLGPEGGFITNYDLVAAPDVYDLTPLGTSTGVYPSWNSDTGSYSAAFLGQSVAPDVGHPGFRYPTAWTLRAVVTTTIASPPVVPAGELLVRVHWLPAITPTDATVVVA